MTISMSLVGVNAGPALVMIPLINAVAVFLTYHVLNNIDEEEYEKREEDYHYI